MGRPALWKAIHDSLADEIAQGVYGPGDQLPTEAELAERFRVNRHTVRRALAALAERDVVIARRGAGVFVRYDATPYPIGRRVRFHQNLLAANRVPEKRILDIVTRPARAREASALSLDPGAMVHVYDGISLSDGVPLATFQSVFPAARFPDLIEWLRKTHSVTQTFAAHGVTDYTRASTEVTARLATHSQASELDLRPGDPVLGAVSLNVDAEGTPIEFGRSWFAAERVTMTVSAAGL